MEFCFNFCQVVEHLGCFPGARKKRYVLPDPAKYQHTEQITNNLLSGVLQEKLLNPFSHMLGIRKQFGKRDGNNNCFWKYCI